MSLSLFLALDLGIGPVESIDTARHLGKNSCSSTNSHWRIFATSFSGTGGRPSLIFVPAFGAVGGISNCVKPPARLPGHVLVAMRERPCEPVTGSVVLEPPVGFMVLISPRSPGMPSPSRPAGGLRAVKQLRRHPLP